MNNFKNVMTKASKYRDSVSTLFDVEIIPNKSITVRKQLENGNLDFPLYSEPKTFVIGDVVEYDSWNLSYTGTIVKIGPKTVSVDENGIYPGVIIKRIKRMNLEDFCRRNWDLDLVKIAEDNAETSYYI